MKSLRRQVLTEIFSNQMLIIRVIEKSLSTEMRATKVSFEATVNFETESFRRQVLIETFSHQNAYFVLKSVCPQM